MPTCSLIKKPVGELFFFFSLALSLFRCLFQFFPSFAARENILHSDRWVSGGLVSYIGSLALILCSNVNELSKPKATEKRFICMYNNLEHVSSYYKAFVTFNKQGQLKANR